MTFKWSINEYKYNTFGFINTLLTSGEKKMQNNSKYQYVLFNSLPAKRWFSYLLSSKIQYVLEFLIIYIIMRTYDIWNLILKPKTWFQPTLGFIVLHLPLCAYRRLWNTFIYINTDWMSQVISFDISAKNNDCQQKWNHHKYAYLYHIKWLRLVYSE